MANPDYDSFDTMITRYELAYTFFVSSKTVSSTLEGGAFSFSKLYS